jgi:hypothetical protein
MIKLAGILSEIKSSEELVSFRDTVEKFIKKKTVKLQKLADSEDWDAFYDEGYREFPDIEQYKVAQEMNKIVTGLGWTNDEDPVEMPTEKQLKDAAFGKSNEVGKGIAMGKYTSKQKLPKNDENVKPTK